MRSSGGLVFPVGELGHHCSFYTRCSQPCALMTIASWMCRSHIRNSSLPETLIATYYARAGIQKPSALWAVTHLASFSSGSLDITQAIDSFRWTLALRIDCKTK